METKGKMLAFDIDLRCSPQTVEDMEHIKNQLKQRVQILLRKCQDYRLVKGLNRSAKENVGQLEKCIMCLARNKNILHAQVIKLSQCKESHGGDTTACLEAELRAKTERVEHTDDEISRLRGVISSGRERLHSLQTCVSSDTNQTIEKEIGQLNSELEMLKNELREKELQMEKDREEMQDTFRETSKKYTEHENIQRSKIEKLQKDIEEGKRENEDYVQKIKDLKSKIENNIKEIEAIKEETEKQSEKVENTKRCLNKKDEKIKSCLHERSKFIEAKNKQEQTIEKLRKQLDNFKPTIKLSCDEHFMQTLRESCANLEKYKKLIVKLTNENDILKQEVAETKKTINDEIKIVEIYKDEHENLLHAIETSQKTFNLLDLKREEYEEKIAQMKLDLIKMKVCEEKDFINEIEEDDMCEDEELNSSSEALIDQNAGLAARLDELRKMLIEKDKILEKLKDEKNKVCADYDNQLEITERYEETLEAYTQRLQSLKEHEKTINKDTEELKNKEQELKETLKRLAMHIDDEEYQRKQILEENKKLHEKMDQLGKSLTAQLAKNEDMKKSVELLASEVNSNNLEETEDALKASYNEEIALRSDNSRLAKEYQTLNFKHDLLIQGNEMLTRIIQVQQAELEKADGESGSSDVPYSCIYSHDTTLQSTLSGHTFTEREDNDEFTEEFNNGESTSNEEEGRNQRCAETSQNRHGQNRPNLPTILDFNQYCESFNILDLADECS